MSPIQNVVRKGLRKFTASTTMLYCGYAVPILRSVVVRRFVTGRTLSTVVEEAWGFRRLCTSFSESDAGHEPAACSGPFALAVSLRDNDVISVDANYYYESQNPTMPSSTGYITRTACHRRQSCYHSDSESGWTRIDSGSRFA